MNFKKLRKLPSKGSELEPYLGFWLEKNQNHVVYEQTMRKALEQVQKSYKVHKIGFGAAIGYLSIVANLFMKYSWPALTNDVWVTFRGVYVLEDHPIPFPDFLDYLYEQPDRTDYEMMVSNFILAYANSKIENKPYYAAWVPHFTTEGQLKGYN